MNRREFDAPAGVVRRTLTRARRAAVALGLATAVAGGVTLGGAGSALAQAAPCQEYVVVFQTTSDGRFTGPGSTTLDPHEFTIDTTDTVHSLSGLPAGVGISFDATSISPDTSVTLWYSVATSTAPGTYTFTVTGTGRGITHSQPITLTVT
jgi:hypothetical protein